MSENPPGGILNLIVRTADQTRKQGIEIDPQSQCDEIIVGAISEWKLPRDTDYTLVNVTQGNTQLDPRQTLVQAGVREGDMLEIQPVLVAG